MSKGSWKETGWKGWQGPLQAAQPHLLLRAQLASKPGQVAQGIVHQSLPSARVESLCPTVLTGKTFSFHPKFPMLQGVSLLPPFFSSLTSHARPNPWLRSVQLESRVHKHQLARCGYKEGPRDVSSPSGPVLARAVLWLWGFLLDGSQPSSSKSFKLSRPQGYHRGNK